MDESEAAVPPPHPRPVVCANTGCMVFNLYASTLPTFPTDVSQSVKQRYHREPSPGYFGAVAPSWSQSMAAVSSYTSLVS